MIINGIPEGFFYHFNENGIKLKKLFIQKVNIMEFKNLGMKMERYHQRDYMKTEYLSHPHFIMRMVL